MGFAFQIADDCLDYEGSLDVVGKAIVADLLEGKVTLPLIFALKNAGAQSEKLRGVVESILEKGEASEPEKRLLVELIRGCEGLECAKQSAQKYAFTAQNALANAFSFLPASAPDLPAARSLKDLISYVMDRKN